jgi:hypothetical protein
LRGALPHASQLKRNFELACAQVFGYPQNPCIALWITPLVTV